MEHDFDRTLALVRDNLRAGRPADEGIDRTAWQALLDRYGHFVDRTDAEGYVIDSEVIVTSLKTPRPCLHLMASARPGDFGTWGSFWDQMGGGFSCVDSVLAGRMTSHLDTNYVPTAPEPQDVRRFFVHEEGRAWPMFPVPFVEEERYSGWRCVQGLETQVLEADREGLACRLEVCVPPSWPLETWRVRITNRTDRLRKFSWFAHVRVNIDSFPSYYFVPRIVCEGIVEDGVLVFLNHDKNNKHPRQAFFAAEPAFDGFDMCGEVFDGIGGRAVIPRAVREGRCSDSLGLQPYAGLVAATQYRVELPPGGSREWICVYGRCPYDREERRAYLARVRREVLADPAQSRREVQAIWADQVSAHMARTPSVALDRYFNVWSKYQNRNQVLFCRALDKVGYRDVLQDMMGLCDFQADLVRAKLLHTLQYQAADGRAVRQYEACPGAGQDMRMYMDSASWIPDTLVRYLKETGDFDVLDERVACFDMAAERPDPSQACTVYEHALRAVRSLAAHTGYHGLCRIGYGDWNDALSGIGGEKGVSVWLSCACVHAAQRMAELARYLGRVDDAEEMDHVAASMTERINAHGWDGRWYIYAINGQGKPIGSSRSPEGRIHLNVNTWALFTGVARAAGREAQVFDSLNQLATPCGLMLLAPPYTAASRPDVGRIADQKPGMFENGSIYLHGQAFYLYALICARRADACYGELMRTLPSAMVQDVATGPRHQQSNFTVGPDHPHYGMQLFSNFTGSVPWYRRVIEKMLGVSAGFDALHIDPCPPSGWDQYKVRKRWRGRTIEVSFHRSETPGCRIMLNGRPFQHAIPLEDLPTDGIQRVEVQFG